MSVKDVRKYYDEVADQYMELRDNLKEFSELVSNNLYSPEKLKEIEDMVQPIKRNYEVLSYVMFLLNKPQKNEKEKPYQIRNKRFLQSIPREATKEGVIQENKSVLNSFQNDVLKKGQ